MPEDFEATKILKQQCEHAAMNDSLNSKPHYHTLNMTHKIYFTALAWLVFSAAGFLLSQLSIQALSWH